MSHSRIPRDTSARLSRAEEQIRMLRLRQANGMPWYSLEYALCGGWFDSFGTGDTRPYKADITVADKSYAAGYYDVGYGLLFTGIVVWDPIGWWGNATAALTAAGYGGTPQGGTPDIGIDATRLFGATDGFGNAAGNPNLRDATKDLGEFLPYTLWRDLTQPANGIGANDWVGGRTLFTAHSYTASGGAPAAWQDGLTVQFQVGNVGAPANLNADHMYAEMSTSGGVRAGGTAKVVDAGGFTHFGVPAELQVDLTGVFIPYGYGETN